MTARSVVHVTELRETHAIRLYAVKYQCTMAMLHADAICLLNRTMLFSASKSLHSAPYKTQVHARQRLRAVS
jgi:hypothetical protein